MQVFSEIQRKFIYSLFFFMVNVIFLTSVSTLEAQISSNPYLNERLVPLGKQLPGSTLFRKSIKVSPDNAHITYVEERDGKNIISLDGKTEASWKKIVAGFPIFSPKLNRIAYIADDGLNAFVVVDGKKGPPFNHIWDIKFSPDGKHFAYPAVIRKNRIEKVYLAVNHKKGPEVYGITQILFSPDSRNLAYIALLIDGKWHVILNGKKGPGYDLVEGLEFSSDSKHLVYTVTEKDKKYVIRDGKRQMFSGDEIGMTIFSPNSLSFAYAAVHKKKNNIDIIINNKKRASLDMAFGFRFSPNSKQYAFQGGKLVTHLSMFINNKQSVVYEGCSDPFFSPDSSKLAYYVKDGSDWYMIVNDKKHKRYMEVHQPVFSEDSSRMAYRVKVDDDEMCMVVDGKEGKRYESVGSALFSSDSKHIAHVVKDSDQWFLNIDGKEEKHYESLGTLTFSDDGKHFAYTAKENGKWFIVVDGQEGVETFDQGIPGANIQFPSSKSLYFLVLKMNEEIPELYRLEVSF